MMKCVKESHGKNRMEQQYGQLQSRVGNMLAKYSKHKSSSKKQCSTFIKELCHEFSLYDLKKATNNFDENRKIGEVNGNIVYKGYVKHNGENDYPIALMRMRNMVEEREFKNEIELHCQLSHPNLISLIGFCNQKNEKVLVFTKDDMVNGSLHDHLCSRDMESLSWKKRLEICIGAAKGLHYLHTGAKRPIYHRDIKPESILLDNNMEPKLWQLGLSLQGKLSKSESDPMDVMIFGTIRFMAPEYACYGIFTVKSDVYSFGLVLFQVISCVNEFSTTVFNKMDMLIEGFPADEIFDPILMRLIAPQCLEVFMDIMKRCMSMEANERPAMGEVEVELEHALALQEEADRA